MAVRMCVVATASGRQHDRKRNDQRPDRGSAAGHGRGRRPDRSIRLGRSDHRSTSPARSCSPSSSAASVVPGRRVPRGFRQRRRSAARTSASTSRCRLVSVQWRSTPWRRSVRPPRAITADGTTRETARAGRRRLDEHMPRALGSLARNSCNAAFDTTTSSTSVGWGSARAGWAMAPAPMARSSSTPSTTTADTETDVMSAAGTPTPEGTGTSTLGCDMQPVLSGRHRPRDLRSKCGPQGERQRVGGDDLAVGRLAERIPTPALEGEYGRLERPSVGGQLVAAANGGDASEHSCLLQLAQAVAQDVRGNTRQSELQVAVAASACEQVANDEQSPPIADPLERPGDAAVLPKPTRLACGQREPSTPRSTRRPVRRPARP